MTPNELKNIIISYIDEIQEYGIERLKRKCDVINLIEDGIILETTDSSAGNIKEFNQNEKELQNIYYFLILQLMK